MRSGGSSQFPSSANASDGDALKPNPIHVVGFHFLPFGSSEQSVDR